MKPQGLTSAGGSLVATVQRVDLRLGGGAWRHEHDNGTDIETHWERARAGNPALFNGRFYILDQWHLYNGLLSGKCVETTYAAYLHWRADGFSSSGLNAFAMPVLRASDGGILISRMAPWTANAGTWYMPAGSIDAEDVRPSGVIDLVGNMRRELAEEIGIVLDDHRMAEDWTVVFVRGRLAMFRQVHVERSSEDLLAMVEAFLAGQEKAELDAVRIIRRRSDCGGLELLPFLAPYLETVLNA